MNEVSQYPAVDEPIEMRPQHAPPAVPELTQSLLNPHAPEFQVRNTDQKIYDMIQTLHMPKTEMSAFDGDPIKYHNFIRAFENNAGRYLVGEHAELARFLLQYTKRKAYQVIESCAAMETGGYERAKQLLHERFGDGYTIGAVWISHITAGAKVTNDTLQEFADELLSFRETLYAIGCMSEVNQQVLVQVAEKLPVYLQHSWKRPATKIRERSTNPGIDDIVQFTQSAAKEVSDPVFGDLAVSHKAKHNSQPHSTTKKGFHGATAPESGSTRNGKHVQSVTLVSDSHCSSERTSEK